MTNTHRKSQSFYSRKNCIRSFNKQLLWNIKFCYNIKLCLASAKKLLNSSTELKFNLLHLIFPPPCWVTEVPFNEKSLNSTLGFRTTEYKQLSMNHSLRTTSVYLSTSQVLLVQWCCSTFFSICQLVIPTFSKWKMKVNGNQRVKMTLSKG